MRRLFRLVTGPVAVASTALAFAPSAAAQEGKCPPGSWFCADASVPSKPTASPPEAGNGGTTVIVNQTSPPDETKGAKKAPAVEEPPPPPKYDPPPEPPTRHRSEWGLQAHFLGALLGSRADAHSGMGGFGFALRARPTSYVALDLGVDFLGGRDYNGQRRSEVPITLNALFFVNPRDKVQVYFLGGLGLSTARVAVAPQTTAHYGYFGVQGGAGLELRLGRKVALNGDAIAFLRGRTDDLAQTSPEFTDAATGKQTNTSGGGLLRAGLTFYWLRQPAAEIVGFSSALL